MSGEFNKNITKMCVESGLVFSYNEAGGLVPFSVISLKMIVFYL